MSYMNARRVLEELIRIDTQNPPGNERALATVKAAHPKTPPIVLSGHMDTVTAHGNWSTEPLELTERGGRLYGRGTADMKGGLAVQLTALLLAHEHRTALPQDVVMAWSAGEETDCCGARAFVEELGRWQPRGIVIGEPTECGVVVAQKGALWIRFTARGVAAHCAYPETGVNAIEECAQLYLTIKERLRGRAAHPLVGETTVNWSVTHGGHSPNVVPDHAEAILDIRYPPPLARASVVRTVNDATGDVTAGRIV